MKSRTPWAAALTAAVTLAGVSPAAHAQQAAGPDPFEAALREARPAPTAPPAATGRGRGGGRRALSGPPRAPQPIAPPGAMPLRFQSMTGYNDSTSFAIRAAVRDGTLDSVAMMEQLARPLPIPPGAYPLRCRAESSSVTYSLGVDASSEYMAALLAARAQTEDQPRATMVNGQMIPSAGMRFVIDRTRLADSATTRAAKLRAEAHLIASGFVRSSGDIVGRWIYRPGRDWRGRTPVNIVLADDNWALGESCHMRGIDVSYGPVMIVTYEQ